MTSMTGFGRGAAEAGGVKAVVECASVNRKALELVWTAPRELASLEPAVRERVAKRVQRGRVTVTASLEPAGGEQSPTVDFRRARAYFLELRRLARSLGIEEPPRLETILAGPGVVRAGPGAGDCWAAVRAALDLALDGLCATRAAEGRRLARALRRGAAALRSLARRARPLAARVPARQRAALEARIGRAGLVQPVDPARLSAEVALLAERCDVTEELDRLDSHADHFEELLESATPVGRPLEFVCQEIAREWNTLGAKASEAALSRLVVSAKTILDRLREQLANIE